jgi:L-cysteine:1D-myo-inositol 2-amino-2-deoxy-alpha-D-glucopyranoside ligase
LLRLHDTLSGRVREFQPAGPVVKLYVCGITPYDATHLGHAFTFVAFDVLIRYLRYLGQEVRYVQNVTDLDDPLYAKARELGVSHWELAAAETRQFLADMAGLDVLEPQIFPQASEEVPAMISLIERLLETGHAYQVDGHIYFSIATDPTYGELSKDDRATMMELTRERGGNPDDALRRDPLDFVLWRPSQPDEPAVPSPWGKGLPGWHLECSAMSLKYLGEPIDIHGGGADLIFPHHENEIAQSEGATGVRPFVRFWMHTGMVYLGGEKMSKSLGNMVFVRDLLPRYGADALRLYLSGCHYRSELHYDEVQLKQAAELARYLARAISLPSGAGEPIELEGYRAGFIERMGDDLDTPGAIAVLRELAEQIDVASTAGRAVQSAQDLLRELGGILGLRFGESLDKSGTYAADG